jgi:hypothetical protein
MRPRLERARCTALQGGDDATQNQLKRLLKPGSKFIIYGQTAVKGPFVRSADRVGERHPGGGDIAIRSKPETAGDQPDLCCVTVARRERTEGAPNNVILIAQRLKVLPCTLQRSASVASGSAFASMGTSRELRSIDSSSRKMPIDGSEIDPTFFPLRRARDGQISE